MCSSNVINKILALYTLTIHLMTLVNDNKIYLHHCSILGWRMYLKTILMKNSDPFTTHVQYKSIIFTQFPMIIQPQQVNSQHLFVTLSHVSAYLHNKLCGLSIAVRGRRMTYLSTDQFLFPWSRKYLQVPSPKYQAISILRSIPWNNAIHGIPHYFLTIGRSMHHAIYVKAIQGSAITTMKI